MRERATAPRRIGERPNLADCVEKLEATAARQGEQIADLQKREAALAKFCDELAARVDALQEAPVPAAARSDPRLNDLALWAEEVGEAHDGKRPRRLRTVAEIVSATGYSDSGVRKKVKSGEFVSHRIGGRIGIDGDCPAVKSAVKSAKVRFATLRRDRLLPRA